MLAAGDKPQEISIGFPNFLVPVLRKRPLYCCAPGFVGRDEGGFMISIYGVTDPFTSELRYIGKTKHGIDIRSQQHFKNQRDTPFGSWIKSLDKSNLINYFFVIEEVEDGDWKEAERFWIAYFKFIDCNLLNKTRGGNGFGDHTPETKAKIGASSRGKVLPLETKDKISISVAAQWAATDSKIRKATEGVPRSSRVVELISIAQTNLWQNPEYIAFRADLEKTDDMRGKRAKASNVRWAKPDAIESMRRPETRKKMSDNQTRLWQNAAYRENQETKARERAKLPGFIEAAVLAQAKIADKHRAAVLEGWKNNPKIWITDGIVNKFHPSEDVIPDGWSRGTISGVWIRITNGTLVKQHPSDAPIPEGWIRGGRNQRVWITNGIESRMMLLDSDIPEGWYLGRKM